MTPHVTLESLATQSTMLWILSSMNILAWLYVVQVDGTLATQSSMVMILNRKTFYVPADPYLATQGLVSLTHSSLNLFFFLSISGD